MINTQATPAYVSRVEPLVKEGKAMPLFAIGFIDDKGNPVRDPAVPDMITAPELYEKIHGKKPSGMVWEGFKAVVPLVQNTRGTIWLQSDIPADAKAAIRIGVDRMVKDPEFIAAAGKILEGYPIMHGDELGQIKASMNAASPEVVAYIRELLKTRYKVEFND